MGTFASLVTHPGCLQRQRVLIEIIESRSSALSFASPLRPGGPRSHRSHRYSACRTDTRDGYHTYTSVWLPRKSNIKINVQREAIQVERYTVSLVYERGARGPTRAPSRAVRSLQRAWSRGHVCGTLTQSAQASFRHLVAVSRGRRTGPDYWAGSSSVKSGGGCTARGSPPASSTRLTRRTLPLDRGPSPSLRLLADRRGRDSSLVVGPLTFLLGGALSPAPIHTGRAVHPSLAQARARARARRNSAWVAPLAGIRASQKTGKGGHLFFFFSRRGFSVVRMVIRHPSFPQLIDAKCEMRNLE